MRFSDILERLHRLLNNSTYVCDTRQRYSLYLSRIYSSLLENPFYHLLRKTKLYEKKEKLNASMLYLILDRKSRLKKKRSFLKNCLLLTFIYLFIKTELRAKILNTILFPLHSSTYRSREIRCPAQASNPFVKTTYRSLNFSRLYLRNVSQFREKKKGKRCGNTLRTRLMMLDAVSLGDMCPE